MSNYKERYLIQVDSVKGNPDSPREDRYAYDDRDWAVQEVNHIDQFRNVYLVDRAEQDSRSALVRAYGQGYYKLPYKEAGQKGIVFQDEDPFAFYMDGLLDRLEADALDHLDDVMRDTETEHQMNINARGGDRLLLTLQNEKHLKQLRLEQEAREAALT